MKIYQLKDLKEIEVISIKCDNISKKIDYHTYIFKINKTDFIFDDFKYRYGVKKKELATKIIFDILSLRARNILSKEDNLLKSLSNRNIKITFNDYIIT